MPIPTSIRNLKNAFLIGDLRNKIIFTLFIIAVYRLGDNIICPGSTSMRFSRSPRRPTRAASSPTSTFSRAAP